MATPELIPSVSMGRKLLLFLLQHFRSVKITSPASEALVDVGRLKISGTYRLARGGDFILCHRENDRYWPYVTVNMNARDKKWSADFTIHALGKFADEVHIVVVELDTTGRILVDYFLEHASKIEWPGIKMTLMPPGFRLCDELIVRRASGQK